MDSVFSPDASNDEASKAGLVDGTINCAGVDVDEDGGIRDSPGTCPRSSGVATKKVKNVSMVFQFITGL